jgi:hypothetical protein
VEGGKIIKIPTVGCENYTRCSVKENMHKSSSGLFLYIPN